MHRLAIVMALGLGVGVAACGKSSTSGKPAGTLSDPVEVCERVADVCRLDKARLGVCVQARNGSGLACQSQH
jgi:hypothetical protein